MNKNSKIYIAGNTGLVGSAITRNLASSGFTHLIFTPYPEYDLRSQQQVEDFFAKEQPEYIFLAAAKVGGILANNTYPAEFIYDNLAIETNIIHAAYQHKAKKLLFLGSSCIYPKDCPQPIREEYLLTGLLEPTNEAYAIAKIAGLKMCEAYAKEYGCNFISVMPTNLYGPNDNYDLEKSHVLPALVRKMHLGKCLENNDWNAIRKDVEKRPVESVKGDSPEPVILEMLRKYGINLKYPPPSPSLQVRRGIEGVDTRVTISLWGTGDVFREFLHVDDMASACVFVMENIDIPNLDPQSSILHPPSSILNPPPSGSFFYNIGNGTDMTIKELAALVKEIVGFSGDILWDASKPGGTWKKQLDVTRLNEAGWHSKIPLKEGIEAVYRQYCL